MNEVEEMHSYTFDRVIFLFSSQVLLMQAKNQHKSMASHQLFLQRFCMGSKIKAALTETEN